MDFCLERLQQGILEATNGLTPEKLTERPVAGKWSAGEILEHLYLTYTGTTRGFEKCLAGSKPLAGAPNWKDGVRRLFVLGLKQLPEGRKAPANLAPKGLAPEQVLRDITTKIRDMDAAITQAELKFGKNARVLNHHVLGPLTGQQWRKFHLVHGRMHLKQLDRLKKAMSSELRAASSQ
jgi:DinB family protein